MQRLTILKAVPDSHSSLQFKLVKYWSNPEKVIGIKVVRVPKCEGQNELRSRCLASFVQMSGKVLIPTKESRSGGTWNKYV